MNQPNLLLAGAPKCGTTSVYDWLIAHPEVGGGVEKELFYLMDSHDWKFNPRANISQHGEETYHAFFKQSAKHIVDGTTLNLYQESAINYAGKYQTKGVFFVREPAARVYSTFRYFRDTRTMIDSSISFEQFLGMLEQGQQFNKNNQISQCIEQSNYVDYLTKWQSAIGQKNMKIFVFEDFIRNPEAGMRRLCDWLEIDADFYKDFDFNKANESIVIRNRKLNKLKELFAPFVRSKGFKDWLRPLYYRLNQAPSNLSEKQQDKAIIEQLKQQFDGKNRQLAQVFGLDLSAWSKK
ncbi:sulfotransferase domain-containing protein [Alginatibacterium sediminis]|uniref:sulfotransferase domain-containing protein n=1 Tax=Alginatibacterium sediminis TaxID=2164068 RepID=UPI001313EA61|nr:sulfotransferase domain-containing protein [Alginatibacterium sediminis]